MASTKKLLSIAIPTYNRSDILNYSLPSILEACVGFEDKVEVIVSDNCSTDNTQKIIETLTSKYSNLTYYRNKQNLGANANFYILTDVYASGKYCWLLGDDDMVNKDTFPYILSLLEKNDIDFLKLNFDIKKLENISNLSDNYIDKPEYYHHGTFGEITNTDSSSANILNTFISASIFRLEPFKNYEKPANYMVNHWNSFKEVFSHSCVHSAVFGKSTNAMFFTYPALSVCQHEKDWDDKMSAICTLFLPQLYYFYLKQGIKKKNLKNTKNIIVRDCIVFLIKGKKTSKTVWSFFFLLRNISTTTKTIFLILNRIFK